MAKRKTNVNVQVEVLPPCEAIDVARDTCVKALLDWGNGKASPADLNGVARTSYVLVLDRYLNNGGRRKLAPVLT